MNSTSVTFERGQLICRESHWTDIVKFFLLNYGLHAVTVVAEPGSRWLPKSINAALAVFVPSAGLENAFRALYRFTFSDETDLDKALKAGALCMLVPSTDEFLRDGIESLGRPLRDTLNPVLPWMTDVHGQYPKAAAESSGILKRLKRNSGVDQVAAEGGKERENVAPTLEGGGDNCFLVQVPHWFEVRPFRSVRHKQPWHKRRIWGTPQTTSSSTPETTTDQDQFTRPNISCNYSVIKSVSAILQILYASFELYRARGDQLEKYGYAAYSLTVIPYLLMSIANLLANCSAPQYPSMYIVHYKGKTVPETPEVNKTTPEPNRTIPEFNRTTPELNKAAPGVSRTPSPEIRVRYPSGWPSGSYDSIGPVIAPVTRAEKGLSASSVGTDPFAGTLKSIDMSGSGSTYGLQSPEGHINYEEITSGAVGNVYGEFIPRYFARGAGKVSRTDGLIGTLNMLRYSLLDTAEGGEIRSVVLLLISIFSLLLTAAPYVIIQVLTAFESRQSTRSQRSWIMCWIVIGQMGATVSSLIVRTARKCGISITDEKTAYSLRTLIMLVFSVPTVGGFVVIAQMMSQDQVCRIL